MEYLSANKLDLINVDVPALRTATGAPEVNDGYHDWSIAGFFGRLNYNYKEKYLFEFVGRYDGSSRFAKGDRFAFLPSGSLGWIVTKEGFMEGIKPVVNYLKLRGSYGEIGNQRVGNDYYPTSPTFPTGQAEWINPENVQYTTLYTPPIISAGFTWERVRTLDVGAEIGLLKNRLSSTFSWYNRQTIGMLDSSTPLPTVLGTGAPKQNVSDLETKGWELELKWKDNIGKDFRYSIGGNLYDSRSYITKLKVDTRSLNNYYVGQEIGELWGYESDGFYNIDDFDEGIAGSPNGIFTLKDGIAPYETRSMIPGDVRFKDLNGDGVVDDGLRTLDDHGDLKKIGSNRLRYQYGINGSASYKNLSLSFFLQGVGKRNRNIHTNVTFPYTSEFNTGLLTNHTNAWTEDNQNAFFPRVASRNYGLAGVANSKYLYDVSYLTIRNITLGYEIPKSKLERFGIDSFRISLSGENLYTFDKLPRGVASDLQIESGGAGYPLLRKFSLGLNLSL